MSRCKCGDPKRNKNWQLDGCAELRELKAEVEQLRKAWPIKGVRVEGEKVIVAVKGGNDAARWLCGELLRLTNREPESA